MRRTLGVLLFAGPFVAGAVAVAGARRDFRLLAMAVVATLTVWLFFHIVGVSVVRTMVALALATGTGAATAMVAGARAPFGVIAVAVVLAAFATVGQLLLRPQQESARALHGRPA